MSRPTVLAAAALLVVAALHLASIPRTIWEYDESLFAMAVERYEPLQHHPPPPGYPIYIGFAKVVGLFAPTVFSTLLATSILGLLAGLAAFFFAFRELTDARTAVVATILLYASPALLISGTLPQSDTGALALFGFAIWACVRAVRGAGILPAPSGHPAPTDRRAGRPGGAGGTPALPVMAIACAAAIGWRLQLSIAVVPMFLVATLLLRTWRARLIAVAAFGLACLAWFVPLVWAAGGPESYWRWLSGQAAYYAHHDADLSRSGQSAALIALRFIAHPWGPKWLSLPLLALAILGSVPWRTGNPACPPRRSLLRTERPPWGQAGLPVLHAACLVYLGFALWSMDPADAVRYAIPSLPLVALLAARGLAHARALAVPLALAYAVGAYAYAWPVLRTRATTPAPPTAAANWIHKNVGRDTIVLFDRPLVPHASYLLRDYKTMHIDAGLAQFGGDPSVPMIIYADGERGTAQGVTFRWPDTDAYRKLTRQHYGAVSVVALPPHQRFRIVHGVHAPERRRDGAAWRWLAARAVIELPDLGATHVRLTFRTPPEYPLDGNRLRVVANGQEHVIPFGRTDQRDVVIPAASRIELIPERSFIPQRIRGANNRDSRTLSIMLTRVEQLGARPGGT